MALTEADIEQMWVKAGGPENVAPLMAAIAMQQSSGNPDAVNHSDPGPEGSVGLFQINSAAHPDVFSENGGAAGLSDAQRNVAAAVALYDTDGLQPWSQVNSPGGGTMENPVISAWQKAGGSGAQAASAALTAASEPLGSGAGSDAGNGSQQAKIPTANFAPPLEGVNVKNFHGYDLSAIPENELGNAERAIEGYVNNTPVTITDAKTGKQVKVTPLEARVINDFGYEGAWVDKLPQVKAVLTWAATSLDPTSAAKQNEFLSAMSRTKWWKSLTENQRAWQQEQSQDPATAQNRLMQARDKVLATANQVGVQLTAGELDQIAHTYAAQSFEPTGTFSSESGTSQDWLDQAVISAITTVGKGGKPSDFSAQTAGLTSPVNLTGIASSLYQQFEQTAQQYLMYNPNGKGLLSDKDLLNYVQQALHGYTGTGSSGQINQFESGALNSFTEQMKDQASKMYPSLAGAIAQGTTPQTYTQPIANVIANTLDIDPSSINFTDPNWSWAIATPDPKTGVKTALTPDQVLQKITNPNFKFKGPNGQTMSYDNTNTAMQTAMGINQSIDALFGKAV